MGLHMGVFGISIGRGNIFRGFQLLVRLPPVVCVIFVGFLLCLHAEERVLLQEPIAELGSIGFVQVQLVANSGEHLLPRLNFFGQSLLKIQVLYLGAHVSLRIYDVLLFVFLIECVFFFSSLFVLLQLLRLRFLQDLLLNLVVRHVHQLADLLLLVDVRLGRVGVVFMVGEAVSISRRGELALAPLDR